MATSPLASTEPMTHDQRSPRWAWPGLAIQKNHRNQTLAAYTETLRRDPTVLEAWEELWTTRRSRPMSRVLAGLFAAAPSPGRLALVPHLLSISDRKDRFGRLDLPLGPELRERLVEISAESGDTASLAMLLADAGKRAAEAGDDGMARDLWRRASRRRL